MGPLRKYYPLFLLGWIASVVVSCSPSQEQYFARSTELAAVVFATQTAEEKLRSTATPTPIPTPALPPTRTPIYPSGWPVIFFDTFSSNLNDWPMGTETNEYVENHWSFAGGKYRWEVNAIQDVHWYVTPNIKSVSDFYLSADLQRISGPEDCSYGLVFRVQDDQNFYLFLISDTQYYSIYRIYNGVWDTLVDWKYLSSIIPGGINRVSVTAQSTNFDFWVNDQQTESIYDPIIENGKVGVTMILHRAGDQAIFEFDNFEVREP